MHDDRYPPNLPSVVAAVDAGERVWNLGSLSDALDRGLYEAPSLVEACKAPERPNDDDALRFTTDCPACRIALAADAFHRPQARYHHSVTGAILTAVEAAKYAIALAGDDLLLAAVEKWEREHPAVVA
jgi:hypothetical protein